MRRKLLQGVGLHRVDLSDVDALIPARGGTELLERSAEAAGIEDFGLRLATHAQRWPHLGAVGLLVREEPTVGHAIRAAEQYFHSHSNSLAFRLAEHKNSAVLRIRLLSVTHGRTRQMTELIVGSTFRAINVLAGSAWAPEAVSLLAPAAHDTHHSRQLFQDQGPVRQQLQRIHAAAEATSARRSGQPRWRCRDYIKHYVEEVIAQPVATMDATVRQLVFALLPSGRCTSMAIANHLGVDRKTVSRQLARRGRDVFVDPQRRSRRARPPPHPHRAQVADRDRAVARLLRPCDLLTLVPLRIRHERDGMASGRCGRQSQAQAAPIARDSFARADGGRASGGIEGADQAVIPGRREASSPEFIAPVRVAQSGDREGSLSPSSRFCCGV